MLDLSQIILPTAQNSDSWDMENGWRFICTRNEANFYINGMDSRAAGKHFIGVTSDNIYIHTMNTMQAYNIKDWKNQLPPRTASMPIPSDALTGPHGLPMWISKIYDIVDNTVAFIELKINGHDCIVINKTNILIPMRSPFFTINGRQIWNIKG